MLLLNFSSWNDNANTDCNNWNSDRDQIISCNDVGYNLRSASHVHSWNNNASCNDSICCIDSRDRTYNSNGNS